MTYPTGLRREIRIPSRASRWIESGHGSISATTRKVARRAVGGHQEGSAALLDCSLGAVRTPHLQPDGPRDTNLAQFMTIARKKPGVLGDCGRGTGAVPAELRAGV